MKEEIRKIFKSKLLLATLVAVLLLPLIYAGLYLWAFWDPYNKMENLPVAIVNEDICVEKNKEMFCFGNDLVDKLKEEKQMNWQFVSRDEANNGLKNKKYYTTAIIPNDFSKNILSVDTDNPIKAEIEFRSRQASNFMASKFTDTAFVKIKSALNEKISKEYFENIFSETRESVFDLKKAADGASELSDGLLEAKDGSKELYDGVDKANSGAVDLKNGLNALFEGSDKLNNGNNSLLIGVKELEGGASNINAGLNNLSIGNSQIISSVSALNSAQQLAISQINTFIKNHLEMADSVELVTALGAMIQVDVGISQVKNGLLTSNEGAQKLAGGSVVLKNGISSLRIGISNISTASSSLKDNLAKARNGSQDLISGLEKIKDGQKELSEGLVEAYDGSKELSDKLNDSVVNSLEKIDEEKNNIQSTIMSSPVGIRDISIDIVNNNGTAFAPYFISLALWVGGMAIFFLVDLTFNSKNKFKEFLPKFGVSLIVAFFQIIILDFVLIKFLGLKVNYLWQFITFGVLLAWCLTIIQMYLTILFGLAGKFIGIVLLMLQLTSSAGSYPIEMAPYFFQFISKYLPMTYSVAALKELISGNNMEIVTMSVYWILRLIFIILFLIFIYFVKPVKILKERNKKICLSLKTKKKK